MINSTSSSDRVLRPDGVVLHTPVAAERGTKSDRFSPEQTASLRTALASLPASAWSFESTTIPAHWIVYMGRYADNEAAEKKKGELRYLAIQFQPLTNPQLAPGLSLGGYDTQEAAQAALQALSQRGVRTARVVQERAPQPGQWLQLATVDAGLRERITAARRTSAHP